MPSRRSAALSLAKSETEAIRIVAVDIPLGALIRLGVAVSIAAIPLLLLVAVATLGLVWAAKQIP